MQLVKSKKGMGMQLVGVVSVRTAGVVADDQVNVNESALEHQSEISREGETILDIDEQAQLERVTEQVSKKRKELYVPDFYDYAPFFGMTESELWKAFKDKPRKEGKEIGRERLRTTAHKILRINDWKQTKIIKEDLIARGRWPPSRPTVAQDGEEHNPTVAPPFEDNPTVAPNGEENVDDDDWSVLERWAQSGSPRQRKLLALT